MGRQHITLLPRHQRLLATAGENLRLARLRRKLTAAQVAERAGISRSTLRMLEKGSAACSLGALLQVLTVLGLEEDISLLAKDDALGRKLSDASLSAPRKRAPRQPKSPRR